MSKTVERLLRVPGQVPLLWLCTGAILAAAAFEWIGRDVYRFVFGDLSPIGVTAAVCVLGVASLDVLVRKGWFSIAGGGGSEYAAVVILGMAMTVPVMVVDWFGGFPEELNIPAPASLLFYPAIAVVAELVFHAMPLGALCLLAFGKSERGEKRLLWVAVAVAALIEPVLQVVWGARNSPGWANTYVGLHLIVFNLLGLLIFRWRGFLTLYVFRVAYYSIWHIAWGHIRLALLFGEA